jgi:branched-chain amino acid transport system substrate-binding protein
LKRIVFLIIGTLLVLGLVLPGCGGTPAEEEEEQAGVVYTFDNNEIVLGIAGETDHTTGIFANLGATVAKGIINGAGGVVIDGVANNITLQLIDTNEATDETGQSAVTAMSAAIDDVDFVMGGFRTEALEVYRDVAMTAQKLFFDCGAATEALSHSVVTNYDKYKYWFKVTPYNEYFLAMNVLRNVNAVAIQIRQKLGMPVGANLNAVIVAEDLEWSRDEQVPKLEAGLAALNITLKHTYLVDSLTSASTYGALQDIVTQGYNPHIIIPVYSGTMGVAFDGVLGSYIAAGALAPMSVGINVMEQFKAAWNTTPPYCAYHVLLDTWAEGVSQTSKTTPFLTAFMAYSKGEYPLYTAATYDCCFNLKACLEDVGYVEGGVAKAKADDIIAWLEDPANAIEASTGYNCVFPPAGTTVGGVPALTEAQVKAIYNIASYGYTYNVNDWKMPPNTAHDLCPAPNRASGIGAQWQLVGSTWKKVGVWPVKLEGVNQVDQYGDWGFSFPGTVPLVIPSYVTAHFGS